MDDFTELKREALGRHLRKHIQGEVRFDPPTAQALQHRRQHLPDRAARRRHSAGLSTDLVATVQIAGEMRMPITARGGGTSLSGQSIGPGIVVDCSKYLNKILDIDPTARTARVQPGVVLDQLNRAAGRARSAVRSRRRHRQPGQPRRHDRQQLRRRSLHRLRQDHRPRPPPWRRSRRRQPSRVRAADAGRVGPSSGLRGPWKERSIAASGRWCRPTRDEIRRRFPRILRRVSGYNLDVLLVTPPAVRQTRGSAPTASSAARDAGRRHRGGTEPGAAAEGARPARCRSSPPWPPPWTPCAPAWNSARPPSS